jgi:hypothetical protein
MSMPDLEEKQMKEFSFWYSETYTFKGWFQAESEEQARTFLARVEDGEWELEELLEFQKRGKGYELELDEGSLEDVSE